MVYLASIPGECSYMAFFAVCYASPASDMKLQLKQADTIAYTELPII